MLPDIPNLGILSFVEYGDDRYVTCIITISNARKLFLDVLMGPIDSRHLEL